MAQLCYSAKRKKGKLPWKGAASAVFVYTHMTGKRAKIRTKGKEDSGS